MSPTLGWSRSLSVLRQGLATLTGARLHVRSLEYFLADTCNLRCRNCAASSPFLTSPNFPILESFVETLGHLAQVLRADQLKLLGGEPLLNKDLCHFARAARRSGIFRTIRVTTNGLLLLKTDPEIWKLADVIEISVYPATQDTLPADLLDSYKKLAATNGKRVEVNFHARFMRATSDRRIEDRSRVERTFSECAEAHSWPCHLLYGNRLYRCSRVPTLDRYLGRIGVEHDDFTDDDGVVIDGRTGLLNELGRYLTSRVPLKACSFCFGTSGPTEEHRQMPVRFVRSRRKGVDAESFS